MANSIDCKIARMHLENIRTKSHIAMSLSRFELESPYGNGITQRQFDMRRKAEILKRNNNKPTQKELFSQTTRGSKFRQRRLDDSCKYLATFASSSDIPGSNIVLQLDDNVPLYNYRPNALLFRYGSSDPPLNKHILQFLKTAEDGMKIFESGVEYDLAAFQIGQLIPENISSYTIEIPYILEEGSIDQVVFSVTYGGSVITYIEPTPITEYSSDNITIRNITLFTEVGYIYKFHLQITLNGNNGKVVTVNTKNIRFF